MMAGPVITEAGYTRFNLSVPLAPAYATPAMTGQGGDGSETSSSVIPGILFGILVPHIICTAFILARAWSRLFLLRKWFLDDTLIVLAWAFSTAVCIVYSIAAQSPRIRNAVIPSSSGPGPSSADLDYDPATYYSQPDTLRPYILRTYVGLILYQLCLCLTKLSILAFYLRIFASRPRERRLAWATVIAVLLFGWPLLFMSIFQCHPSAGLFFGRPMRGCFTFDPLLVASTALHAATDAWLMVLIIPCVVRLADLSPRQRAALSVVLSLGVFVVAAGLVRLLLSLRAGHRPGGDGVGQANTLAFFVMTVLELDVALICASAPTLGLLVARLWPRLGLGTGEQSAPGWRGGRRRGGGGGDDDETDDGSLDLTSVVSYHGYPWTRPGTPAAAVRGAESKNPSVVDMPGRAAVPSVPGPPPQAVLAHRTPTTLSLRSFMSSMAPRSRGQTLAGGGGEDRAGLLGDGDAGAEQRGRRRSSVGFEGYYDQYLGYGEPLEKRRSRGEMGEEPGRSRGSRCYSGARWGDSQESFVLGMNDPNSPSRLSPVSGLNGAAKPLPRRPAGSDDKALPG